MAGLSSSAPGPETPGAWWSVRRSRRIPIRARRPGSWPVPGRTAGVLQGEGSVDEADMREGLGKVAEKLAGRRIDLFGEQSHVISPAGQGVERRVGFVELPLQDQALDEPERAEEKGAFAARLIAAVPEDQLVLGQL